MKPRFPRLAALLALALPVADARAQSPDPLSVEAELASLRVLPGFEVRPFATERDGVVKPIQIRFDADGRLWMVGSVVYPQIAPGQKADDKVLVLEDTDHDGRVDRTTVFADGLSMPTGLELGDGGVYVGVGTELLHLRDTDGDGRADQRRMVLSGFGTGDTHQTLNSFTWGPSGELMMSQGLHAISRVETPWGTEQLRQAGVWRFWPRRLRLDAFWDGAMGAHNPFGTAFDAHGQPFVFAGNGHGVYHLTPAMIRADHFLLQPSIWNQGRKFGGADFVENGHWPASHQGEVVAGGYLQNTVERFRITEAGSSFQAERLPPLVESTNTAFRIVDVRFGPDGALYLCDWCNPVIGHYQTSFRHPDRDKTRGRIWRVTAKDRPLVAWQPLGRAPAPRLLEALGSPERWDRQLAKRVLAERPGAEVAGALASWAGRAASGGAATEPLLYEALGLHAAREEVSRDLLVRAASARAPWVRAYAARVAGHWADRIADPLSVLAPLASDLDPRVRLEAVVACAYVPEARAVEVAAAAMEGSPDPALEYAFTQAVATLKPRWQEPFLRGELRFDRSPARLAAFTRADRSVDTVSLAVSRLRRIGEVALDAETQGALLQLVADAGGPADLAILLPVASHRLGTNYNVPQHARILDAVASAHRLRGVAPAGDLGAALRPLVEQGEAPVRAAALRLAGGLGVRDFQPLAAAVAQDPRAAADWRAAAVSALGGYADVSDRVVLRQVATEGAADPRVRSRALVELARLEPAPAGPAAAAFLATGPGDAWVTEVFGAFLARPEALASLRPALVQRPPPADASKIALRLMASGGRRDEALASRLEDAAGLRREAHAWSSAEVAAFVAEARRSGDAVRGEAVFRRPELGCAQCHGVNAATLGIGPDLGALGTAQTADFIVGAILEPQREVKEGFMAIQLTLRDGEELTGRIVAESPEQLVLHDTLTRRDVRVQRDRVAERRDLGSVMPAGLTDTLTRAEFRDLVTYLSGLGRRAP